ncbi:hypothetical protein XH89_32030 [Bradyrhizobium sp. CCBAU 53340]|nr:hypothetical protein XH89_32030 [Bradyrhizobium sp. CCBAU 53340]
MVVAPSSTQQKRGCVAARFQSRSVIQEIEMTKTGTSDHRILTQRARAAHLAGKVIDERADNSAKGDDQAMRRQRLIEGPSEFRAVRVDRSRKTIDR